MRSIASTSAASFTATSRLTTSCSSRSPRPPRRRTAVAVANTAFAKLIGHDSGKSIDGVPISDIALNTFVLGLMRPAGPAFVRQHCGVQSANLCREDRFSFRSLGDSLIFALLWLEIFEALGERIAR